MAPWFPWTSSQMKLPKPVWRRQHPSCCLPLHAVWWWRRQQCCEPVISIHQVQPNPDGSSDCIWQKSILMGEKCQLPDFSGAIVYDPAGNLIAPGSPCQLLTIN